ncbi:unnamed protein product, partial [marine sediment metagenome]
RLFFGLGELLEAPIPRPWIDQLNAAHYSAVLTAVNNSALLRPGPAAQPRKYRCWSFFTGLSCHFHNDKGVDV